MKICLISDTHNRHNDINIPESDMIIHAGDCTNTGTTKQIREFCEWYGNLNQKYKILIAGNHDWGFEKDILKHKRICEDNGIVYLQDSSITIENLNIHGSPQTPEFCDWAFNCYRSNSEKVRMMVHYKKNYPVIDQFWNDIPFDTDILITHGPVYNILDECFGKNVGCEELERRVNELDIKAHICGHIHHSYGHVLKNSTHYFNAAQVNDGLAIINDPILFDIENKIITLED